MSRKRIYEIIEKSEGNDKLSSIYDFSMIVIIIISLIPLAFKEENTLVFGLAVFIVSHTFNVSPAVQRILISGYTQRPDKDGGIKDDYIYSIKFPRDMFEQRDLSRIVPKDFCLSAENKCNMTASSLFKAIVPFDSFE